MTIARITNGKKLEISGQLLNGNPSFRANGDLYVNELTEKEVELYFDGDSDRVSITNTNNRLQPTQNTTWEITFKLDSYTKYNTLMALGSNFWDMRMDAPNRFRCHWNNADVGNQVDVESTYNLDDGEWHTLSVVFDGVNGELRGYIDGSDCTKRVYGTTFAGMTPADTSGSGTMAIGSRPGGNLGIHGNIKEVRIWDTVRTAQEIADNVNKRLSGGESDLKTLYPLNEGTGVTVNDLSPNNYDGDINGASWKGGFSFRADGSLQVVEFIEKDTIS